MKARWIGALAVAAAVAALLAYKQVVKTPAPPTAAETTGLGQRPAVLLFADPREAGKDCGCGQIIRLARDAEVRGLAVQEIAPDSGDERIRAHHVVVSPTVLVLDASGNEVARHEGEDVATITAIREDLEHLLQETR